MTLLSELLSAHGDDRPIAGFIAHHAGFLVGDGVERFGPVKVTAVLGRTAVVLVEHEFRTARLPDLAVDPDTLNWRPASDYDLRLMDSRKRGRRALVLRMRRNQTADGWTASSRLD